jgi:hypothetical protein
VGVPFRPEANSARASKVAEHIGPPSDTSEAERIEWIPPADIRSLVATGDIASGPTLIGLLLAGA